ncbi:MAG: helix-turn-helix domain-containing protein [Acidimicrobiales bacterium]
MNGSVVRGLYTVVEAAQLLGVGRSTMYELVARGEVSSVRLGRKVLITRATLEALLGFTPPTPAELAVLRSTEPLASVDRHAGCSSTASERTPAEGVDGSARRR